jgi:hypothetical protein
MCSKFFPTQLLFLLTIDLFMFQTLNIKLQSHPLDCNSRKICISKNSPTPFISSAMLYSVFARFDFFVLAASIQIRAIRPLSIISAVTSKCFQNELLANAFFGFFPLPYCAQLFSASPNQVAPLA